MKKMLSILMCVVISFSIVLSGCVKSDDGKVKQESTNMTKEGTAVTEETSIVTDPGTFPIVKDKVNLRILVGQSRFVQDINTNEFTKYYEDKTNVHIDWDVISGDMAGDAVSQKVNIVLASGSYPDVFMLNPNVVGQGAAITRSQQLIYGNQGVFIPLNNLIDKYTVNIKNMLKEDGYINQSIITPNGNIYGLPSISYVYHMTAPNKMWVYESWLKKLNISEPETTEDFYQMLKAFKEKDPNGNGKADEIPLAAQGTRYNGGIIDFIMNAFIPYSDFISSSKDYIQENGKVEFVPSKEEFRDGLRYIRKLYSEGLIAKETITMDRKQITALGENPDIPVLGTAPGLWFGSFTVNGAESGRYKEYIGISPLKGPNGVRGTVTGLTQNAGGCAFNITSVCKYPEVAMRWVDWFYSFEGGLTAMYGMEGIGWRKGQEGEKGIDGQPALYAALANFGTSQNVSWSNMAQFYEPEKQRLGVLGSYVEVRLYNLTKDKYENLKVNKSIPDMYMTEDQSIDLAELDVVITTAVDQAMAQFITGEKDIEKDWDSFVSNLDRLGLKHSLEIRQAVYDANNKK